MSLTPPLGILELDRIGGDDGSVPRCQDCTHPPHVGPCPDSDGTTYCSCPRRIAITPRVAMPGAAEIIDATDAIRDLLLAKNARYGNSALDPVRILSKADAVEQIKVRIDDKLSRLARGNGEETEDVIMDLAGYFVLLIAARRRATTAAKPAQQPAVQGP